MSKISAADKSIPDILSKKFAIDYYQREFLWASKQIEELLNDLFSAFSLDFDEKHARNAVKEYKHYFLGSIIISKSGEKYYIVDGQQRLTSLTLLLIYLYHAISESDSNEGQRSEIRRLIARHEFDENTYNIDFQYDSDRAKCMKYLFEENQIFDNEPQSISTRNIIESYREIKQVFSENLNIKIPYFIDWLLGKVYLVEISANSNEDAYTIFETVNDRGLSLTPTDMLKSYLLSKISDDPKRKKASEIWRSRITSLHDLGKNEESSAIKNWLRSQYAVNILDYEKIGSGFHRWIRDENTLINLKTESDFVAFIEQDLEFYAEWYKNIHNYAGNYTHGLEAIYYNNQNKFTLQYPVLMSALKPSDSHEDIIQKLRLISNFLDILVHRYMWNWKSTQEKYMRQNMFDLIKIIRGENIEKMSNILFQKLEDDDSKFSSNRSFGLRGRNGNNVHDILARITEYIEVNSGRNSRYTDYIVRRTKAGYQIEHIWANKFDRHKDEFAHEAEFFECRNLIGGLLLLEKQINASLGDDEYSKKCVHYLKQNLLAESFNEIGYEKNPGFRKFIQENNLNFTPHSEFKKIDIDVRQQLYLTLAEKIWDPHKIKNIN